MLIVNTFNKKEWLFCASRQTIFVIDRKKTFHSLFQEDGNARANPSTMTNEIRLIDKLHNCSGDAAHQDKNY